MGGTSAGAAHAAGPKTQGVEVAEQAAGRWERSFPPDVGAPRQARVDVEAMLRAADADGAAVASALVVLSELVANAIRHARTEVTVSAIVDGGILRLEVVDRDTRPPALMGIDSDSTSGRGLHIVAGLSRDWGWQTADADDGVAGKVVWAEVPLDACARFDED